MALLALQSDEYISNLYEGRPLPQFSSVKELLAKLSEVRECGYALHNNTLAVSIDNCFQAAIGFSSPKISSKNVSRYLPRLIKCKETIIAEVES
jgi:DNA-binding IclR family transcriptional regulator